jgi:hypothetical protein
LAESVDVVVEFYGIPRQRAGRASVHVAAGTVRGALKMVVEKFPSLIDVLQADGRISPHYLLSLDGTQFIGDLNRSLLGGERLLLLSADAGG